MIKFVSIFFILFLFFSCKKDPTVILTQSTNNTSVNNDTMLPLAVGNYWIYQKSNDDTLGNLNLQNEFDSVYVEKDTFIVGEMYYKLRHTNINFYYYYNFLNYNGVVYLRDSSNYLISSDHRLLLDKFNLHDTILKSVHSIYDYSCVVPDDFTQRQFVIGNYSGLSMNCIYIRNIPQHNIIDTVCAQMFVDKIGIAKSVYGFVSCSKYCKYSQNLIRYHLN